MVRDASYVLSFISCLGAVCGQARYHSVGSG